jgi:hypothetical protein
MIEGIEKRLDLLQTDMNRRFELLRTDMNRQFDLLDTKVSRWFVWLVGVQVMTLAAVVTAMGAILAALAR